MYSLTVFHHGPSRSAMAEGDFGRAASASPSRSRSRQRGRSPDASAKDSSPAVVATQPVALALFVGNIPFQATEEEFLQFCANKATHTTHFLPVDDKGSHRWVFLIRLGFLEGFLSIASPTSSKVPSTKQPRRDVLHVCTGRHES